MRLWILNATKLSQILALSSIVVFIAGLFIDTEFQEDTGAIGVAGFLLLIFSSLTVYFFFNKERDKRIAEEEEYQDYQNRISIRTSCIRCGTVYEGREYCPNCNTQRSIYGNKSYKGMYALSILLGFLGGIIAWASLRNENPSVGVKCLILGIIVTIVSMGIGAVFLFWNP